MRLYAFIDKREQWDEYSINRVRELKRVHETLVKIATGTSKHRQIGRS